MTKGRAAYFYNSLRTRLVALYRRERGSLPWWFWQIVFALLVIAFFVWIPPPNISTAAMGVAAGLVAFHQNMNDRQRLIWIAIIVLLGISEYRATAADALTKQQEASAQRRTEEENFKKVLDASGKGFDGTAKKLGELASQSTENLRAMTGGDSFAYAQFIGTSADDLHPMVFHVGKYPLYNLNATIADLKITTSILKGQPSDLSPEVGQRLLGSRFSFAPGSLPPGQVWTGQAVHIPFNADDGDFRIDFSALNGLWSEILLIRGTAGKRSFAIRVMKEDPKDGHIQTTILMERVDPTFPRDAKGNVEWSTGH